MSNPSVIVNYCFLKSTFEFVSIIICWRAKFADFFMATVSPYFVIHFSSGEVCLLHAHLVWVTGAGLHFFLPGSPGMSAIKEHFYVDFSAWCFSLQQWVYMPIVGLFQANFFTLPQKKTPNKAKHIFLASVDTFCF